MTLMSSISIAVARQATAIVTTRLAESGLRIGILRCGRLRTESGIVPVVRPHMQDFAGLALYDPPLRRNVTEGESAALVAGWWALLGAERRSERGRVDPEARLPPGGGRIEPDEAVEANIPAGGVSGRGTGRELVDQDQPRPAVPRSQLEAQHLLPPAERESLRRVDLEHFAGERHVDDLGREWEGDGGAGLPAAALDDHVAGEPRPELLAIGEGLPDDWRRIGKVPFEAHGGPRAVGEQGCVVHVVLRRSRWSSSRSRCVVHSRR